MSQNYEPQYFFDLLKPVDGNEDQLTGWLLIRKEEWTPSYQRVCLYGYSDAPIQSLADEGRFFKPINNAYSLLETCVGQLVGMYMDIHPTRSDERPAFEKMLLDVIENGIEVIACRTLNDLSAGDPQVLERLLDLERQGKVSIILTKSLEGDNQLWVKMLAALLEMSRKEKNV